MSVDGDTFYTDQQGIDWGVPELEKPLIFPLFPAYSCPYRGLYFHRDRH